MKKAVIILGAGKGLGNHIAKVFGKNGFRVALMARNEAALKGYQAELEADGIECDIRPVDAANFPDVTRAISEIREKYGTPDTLVYNVGVTAPDAGMEITAELLLERYRVDVAGCYHAAQEIATDEFCRQNGTILVTGGGLALHPEKSFLPLSLDKAALRSLCRILRQELAPKGVHVGLVTVCGGIRPGTYFAPENIAEQFWQLYQNRSEFEIQYEKIGGNDNG